MVKNLLIARNTCRLRETVGMFIGKKKLANTSGSSIAEHMINRRECVADFNVNRFSILSRSHSIFHLKVLETLYVRSLQPSLCKQRNCLLGLNVISL